MINVEYVVEGQTDLLLTTTTATTSQKIDPRWWWRQRHLYEIARCLWIDCTTVCRFSFVRAVDACRIGNGLVLVFRIKAKGFFWIQDKKKIVFARSTKKNTQPSCCCGTTVRKRCTIDDEAAELNVIYL